MRKEKSDNESKITGNKDGHCKFSTFAKEDAVLYVSNPILRDAKVLNNLVRYIKINCWM